MPPTLMFHSPYGKLIYWSLRKVDILLELKIFIEIYRIAQNGGRENFGKFGESGAIHQSFSHPNLYHKTAGRLCDDRANTGEHTWLKLVTTKPIVVLRSVTATVYASISWVTRFSFIRRLCFVIESIKLNIFIFVSSWVSVYPLTTLDTANAHTILAPHVMIK